MVLWMLTDVSSVILNSVILGVVFGCYEKIGVEQQRQASQRHARLYIITKQRITALKLISAILVKLDK